MRIVKKAYDYKSFNSYSSIDKYGRFKQEKLGQSQRQENAKMWNLWQGVQI